MLIFGLWLGHQSASKMKNPGNYDEYRLSLTETHLGQALNTSIAMAFMLIALNNFSKIVKKSGNEHSSSYKKYMIFHLVFVMLNIICGILVAISAYPYRNWRDQGKTYTISIISWSLIRKSSEFSILLLLDRVFQNQQDFLDTKSIV